MKQQDKILIVILSIWSFIHCFFMLKVGNIKIVKDSFFVMKNENVDWVDGSGGLINVEFKPTEMFYPSTKQWGDTELNGGNFNLDYYDYTEFFVYIVGAWGLFFIYKLLSKEGEEELK